MKVWIFNHYATEMFENKAGRHYWFAKYLKKDGVDTSIFCASSFLNSDRQIDTGSNNYIVKQVDEIPFVFVKAAVAKKNNIGRVLSWLQFYINLFSVTKSYESKNGRPDIIIASSVHPLTMVAGIQIARKFKIPCICEIRDLWPEAIFQFGKAKEKSIIGRLMIKGEHWIYRNAASLIFTKEGDVDYLKERRWTLEQGGDIDLKKCYYINNGIDLADYDYRACNLSIEDNDLVDKMKFNVTYTGTIRPVNDVATLLDTAVILRNKKNYDDIQFLIYGDGVQLRELRRRVKNENLVNVKLKGFINRQYIPYILNHSDVTILNYAQKQYNWTRGNSSNKLFEYMASGKPIISTVRMGYSIINRYQCGVELEQDTPELLAEQIIRFHDMSREERDSIGKNARDGAKDFDFRILTDKLLHVIESVVQCGN